MMISLKNCHGLRFRRKRLLPVGLFVSLVCIAAKPGMAQTAAPQPPPASDGPAECIAEPRVPVVPLKEPRPAQGPNADQKWQIIREGADKAPVASFIDATRGNDAALEVLIGQGRLLTLKTDIVSNKGTPVIAVADPTIAEFEVLPNTRMLRVTGRRAGTTDLSIVTADGQTYSFEVRVIYDLDLLRATLKQMYPDAHVNLTQLRNQVVVEGEARTPEQVTRIMEAVRWYVQSIEPKQQSNQGSTAPAGGTPQPPAPAPAPGGAPGEGDQGQPAPYQAGPESRPGSAQQVTYMGPRIINLLRVPGASQVMLKVQIAELNRTALRQIGADILGVEPHTGNIYGTNIAGSTIGAAGLLGLGGLTSAASGAINPANQTAFGIFPSGDFEILLRALRKNSLVSIMAEPNLVAINGHRASFLAGGQFPVPVPQSGGGLNNTVTVEWKDFGVQLDFVPFVLDDDNIRLSVTPEVSTIDFSLGTVLVQGGTPVPGLNTRRATTTVEMREGQTLAIAGLLSVEIDGNTARIPGLGDLPYIGPLFSNTSHQRIEKELLVLVSPHLAAAMDPGQVPCLPGADVKDPTDFEFYLKNRIEGRRDACFRSTADWDEPPCCKQQINLERRCVSGPVGFSD